MSKPSSRTFVLEEFGKPLVERVISIPALSQGQVLIRLLAAGVCGSDVHICKGEDPRVPLPLIPGHEGVGLVAETGGPVKTVLGQSLKSGDLVIWNRGLSCGACYHCQVLKQPALCGERRVPGINISAQKPPYLNGCYSEYTILAAGTDVFRIDQAVDPAALVSASCSGATVAHGFDLAPIRSGDTVVIQGPGPLGIWAAAFARRLGAGLIIMIGGSPRRLDLGRRFGADLVLNRKETSVSERLQQVLALTNGRGADLVIEAAGQPQALSEGLELVRRGGTWLSLGFSQPVGTVPLDPYRHIVLKNIRIQGVWVSDTSHVLHALKLVLANPLLFAEMVTHRFPLSQANAALAVMADRTALKAVLEVNQA